MNTLKQVEIAEKRLGFVLPEAARTLYLRSGSDFASSSGVRLFDINRATEEYVSSLKEREHGQPEWPKSLLPVCDWGCNIYSCLDCRSYEVPVIRVDYNLDMAYMKEKFELGFDFAFYLPYSNAAVAAWTESPTVEVWLNDWIAGVDLFHAAYPPQKSRLVG